LFSVLRIESAFSGYRPALAENLLLLLLLLLPRAQWNTLQASARGAQRERAKFTTRQTGNVFTAI
jgi:hypothetical protein